MEERVIGARIFVDVTDLVRGMKQCDSLLTAAEKRMEAYASRVSSSTAQMSSSLSRSLSGAGGAHQEHAHQVAIALTSSSDAWSKYTSSVIGQVQKLQSYISAARMAVSAFTGVFETFFDMSRRAVQITRVRNIFTEMVGGSAEAQRALEEMRRVTLGTISDTELMSSAVMMLRRGYASTAAEAAELVRNVTLAAQSVGRWTSAEQALVVFNLALANMSTLRLDEFGVDAGVVNKRVNELVETMKMTRQEAYRLVVIDEIRKYVESLGLNAETAETRIGRMQAAVRNAADVLAEAWMPFIDKAISSLHAMAQAVADKTSFIQEAFRAFNMAIEFVQAQFTALGVAAVNAFFAIREALRGNTDAARGFLQQAIEAADSWVTMRAGMEGMQRLQEQYYNETARDAEIAAQRERDALQSVLDAEEQIRRTQMELRRKLAEASGELATWEAEQVVKQMWRQQDRAIELARRREDIARQTAARIAQIESQYAQAIRAAEQSYRNALLNAEQQFADARIRIEQSYQTRRRDILRRSALDEIKAIRERDALALVDARQRRDEELREAEEQRNEEMAQAEQAYRRQIEAARVSYEQQLQAARENRVQQLAELRASLAEQEQEYQIAQARREEDEMRALERERGQRAQAIGQKLADIYLANQQELQAMQQHYAQLEQEAAQYYQTVAQYYSALNALRAARQGAHLPPRTGPSFGVPPGLQEGGYAGPGIYRLGERGREFVLSAPTTAYLERLFGPLSQRTFTTLDPVQHRVSGAVTGQIDVAVRQSIAGMEGRVMALLNERLRTLFRV